MGIFTKKPQQVVNPKATLPKPTAYIEGLKLNGKLKY